MNICGQAFVYFGDEQVSIRTGLNSDGEGVMYLMPRIDGSPMDIPDDAINVRMCFKNTKSIDTLMSCLTAIKNTMEENKKCVD